MLARIALLRSTHPGYEVVLLELQLLRLQLRLVIQLQLRKLHQIIRTVTAQPRGDLKERERERLRSVGRGSP